MTKPRKNIDDMINEMRFKNTPAYQHAYDRHMADGALIDFYESLILKGKIKKDGAGARRLNEIKLRKFQWYVIDVTQINM